MADDDSNEAFEKTATAWPMTTKPPLTLSYPHHPPHMHHTQARTPSKGHSQGAGPVGT